MIGCLPFGAGIFCEFVTVKGRKIGYLKDTKNNRRYSI